MAVNLLERVRAAADAAEALIAAAEASLRAKLNPDHPDFLLAQLVRAEALRARGDAVGAKDRLKIPLVFADWLEHAAAQ